MNSTPMNRQRVKIALTGLSVALIGVLLLTILMPSMFPRHSYSLLLEIQQVTGMSSSSTHSVPVTYSRSSTFTVPGYEQRVTQIRQPVGVNLMPGAINFYKPLVKPVGPSVIDEDPMGQWGDIFQRVTSELTTDTMEIANLDNQVKINSIFAFVPYSLRHFRSLSMLRIMRCLRTSMKDRFCESHFIS